MLANGIENRIADNLLTRLLSHGNGVAQQEQQWLLCKNEMASGIVFFALTANATG
jgi:hypothetical protein